MKKLFFKRNSIIFRPIVPVVVKLYLKCLNTWEAREECQNNYFYFILKQRVHFVAGNICA